MKVNDDLTILKLPMTFGGTTSDLNLSLIVDDGGLALVDTGLPGQEGAIEAALLENGHKLEDVKWIILTHQDIDHVGALHALKEKTGATLYAHAEEIPCIDGSKPMVKSPSPEVLAANPEFAAVMKAFRPTRVDKELTDGQVLDLAGGVRVVVTPGHTPGHISLYLERSKALISGDALTSENGKLNGPGPRGTPDMKTAYESVNKLAGLDVDAIVCYHGGLVNEDANGQLQRVTVEAP